MNLIGKTIRAVRDLSNQMLRNDTFVFFYFNHNKEIVIIFFHLNLELNVIQLIKILYFLQKYN
jgi:hypothetical protein